MGQPLFVPTFEFLNQLKKCHFFHINLSKASTLTFYTVCTRVAFSRTIICILEIFIFAVLTDFSVTARDTNSLTFTYFTVSKETKYFNQTDIQREKGGE